MLVSWEYFSLPFDARFFLLTDLIFLRFFFPVSTIKVELEAEIQHSKSLQSKLKLTSTSSLPLARHGQGEEGAYKKLQEDHEELKSRLHLNEDCTGLMVNSFKRDPMGDVYSCVMSDLLQKTGCELIYSCFKCFEKILRFLLIIRF